MDLAFGTLYERCLHVPPPQSAKVLIPGYPIDETDDSFHGNWDEWCADGSSSFVMSPQERDAQ